MAPTAHLTFRLPIPPPRLSRDHPHPPSALPLLDVTDTLSLLPSGGVSVGLSDIGIIAGTLFHRSFTTTEGTGLWWKGTLHGQDEGIFTLILIGGMEADARVMQRVLMGLPPIFVPEFAQMSFRRGSGVAGRRGYRNSVIITDEESGEVCQIDVASPPTIVTAVLPSKGTTKPNISTLDRDLPPIPTSKTAPPEHELPKIPTPPPSPGAIIAKRVDEIAHSLTPNVPVSQGMSPTDWDKVEQERGSNYGIPVTELPLKSRDDDDEDVFNPLDVDRAKQRRGGLEELDRVMGVISVADFAVINPPTSFPLSPVPTTSAATETLEVPEESRRSSFASTNANGVFETASEGGSDSSSDTATIHESTAGLVPPPAPAPARPLSSFELLAHNHSHSHPLSASSMDEENAVLLNFLNSSTFTVQAVTAREIKERGLIKAGESATWWEYLGLNSVSKIWSWMTEGWWSAEERDTETATRDRKSFIPSFSSFRPLGASLSSLKTDHSAATRRMPARSAAGESSSRYSVMYYDEEGWGWRAYMSANHGLPHT